MRSTTEWPPELLGAARRYATRPPGPASLDDALAAVRIAFAAPVAR